MLPHSASLDACPHVETVVGPSHVPIYYVNHSEETVYEDCPQCTVPVHPP